VKRLREPFAFLLLLILGLVPRLLLISKFPTIPTSDFHNLITFALHLRDAGLTNRAAPWFWKNFNVGMPLVLCALFKLFPSANPDALARLATASLSGLFPLLPFFLWRGVLSFRLRLLAGIALAIWPGQVLFSGVVAQDNWVLFPSIALGALAVRALVDQDKAWPITAGLLYAAAVAMRQDMLLILPLLLAAVRIDLLPIKRRQVLTGCLAAVVGLFGLATYRYAASGRFSLSTEHGGVTILGSYIPGSSFHGWVAPYVYLASVRPDLLRDRQAILSQSLSLAVHEALRRPAFHAMRILSMAGVYAIDGESSDPLYSSLEDPEVLPPAIHNEGAALAASLKSPLRIEMAIIHALFLAAVIIGLRRRNSSILILASAVLLKYAFHSFIDFYGRFFFVTTAFEILAITLAVGEILRPAMPGQKLLLARALAAGAAFSLALVYLAPPMLASVQSRDLDTQQHTYHFYLVPPDGSAELACQMNQGLLAEYFPELNAVIRTLQPYDPAPGDKAVAECTLTGLRKEPRLEILQVSDPFDPGGLGGQMVQRVELDGREVYSHDVGLDPGSGWSDIPLGPIAIGMTKKVVIEVQAIHPAASQNWAYNSRTGFQLATSSALPHLAIGKPTSQSSTVAEYPTAHSQSAVDGKTGGHFFDGSTTHTGRDANSWWQVDLQISAPIGDIVIWNRTDCCSDRLSDYWVFVSNTPFTPADTPATLKDRPGTWSSHQTTVPDPSTRITTNGASARYVRVQLSGTNSLSLAEVQVFPK
jgi:hypothetical protein